jgi:hypothetical protein
VVERSRLVRAQLLRFVADLTGVDRQDRRAVGILRSIIVVIAAVTVTTTCDLLCLRVQKQGKIASF